MSQSTRRSISLVSLFRCSQWGRWSLALFFAFTLLCDSGMAYEVSISSTDAGARSLAKEPPSASTAAIDGIFLVQTTPPASDITVNIAISPDSRAAPSDYVLQWVDRADGSLQAFSGTVILRQGNATVEIRLTPTHDTAVEGKELVTLTVQEATPDVNGDKAYSVGRPTAATVTIGDNDHRVKIFAMDPQADEDSFLDGYVDDPLIARRGVMRVQFDQWGAATPFDRNVAIKFEPPVQGQFMAEITKDYVIKYKICGNSNTTTTSESSRIGFIKDSIETTGLNFRLMAALVGEYAVPLRESDSEDPDSPMGVIPDGATIIFASDPDEIEYTVVTATPSRITLQDPLQSNIPSGTEVIIADANGGTAPENLVVERTYGANSTLLRVGDGYGRLYKGDVFQMPENDEVSYVILDEPVMLQDPNYGRFSGEIRIRQYYGGTRVGLQEAQTTDATLITLIPVKPGDRSFPGDTLNLAIPQISTRVEISVEPITEGDGAEGVEDVKMSLVANDDYLIESPTADTLQIADRDVTATISKVTDAGLPNQTGFFRIRLTKPFLTRTVDIGYQVSTSPVNQEGVVFAALPTRFVTLGGSADSIEALIPINPIPTATLPVGYQSVGLTLSLDSSVNYRRAGSSSSTTDPSATMNIANYRGEVSLVTTQGIAIESPTAPPATTGILTLSLARIAGQTGELGVNLSVGGSAASGRYTLIDVDNPSTTYPISGGRILVTFGQQFLPGPVANPAGVTKRIGIRPNNNFLADGNQSVTVSIAAGQSYTIASGSSPRTVNIIDDEPTISVAAVNNGSRPSTPGLFSFTCNLPNGTQLTQPVDVYYNFNGSTAVLGTDFTAQDDFITINPQPPGSTTAPVAFLAINPTDTTNSADLTVTVNVESQPTYNGTPSASLTITGASDDSGGKPTPGIVNSGSSSGGCGLGSGLATLLGLGLFALLAFRRRQD